MKPWFYYGDFESSKKPATLDEALVDVCDIAAELAPYAGNLGGFAYSLDKLDNLAAQALRAQMALLAWGVVLGDLTENETAQVHAALAFVCSGDEYAAEEIAGRFLSMVRRIRVVRALGRHPRAERFRSLADAIGRGRFTRAQWDLAKKIAAEAGEPVAAREEACS